MFVNKKIKSVIITYKDFINKRLNIITILKKLELIQLPENSNSKKNNNSSLNIINSPIKLNNNKIINNYVNEN